MVDCLRELTTADDLSLKKSFENLYKFINNNLGQTSIKSSINNLLNKFSPKAFIETLDTNVSATLTKRNELVQNYLRTQDEVTQTDVIASLDMSQFSKQELLSLVRSSTELHNLQDIRAVHIYKDYIFVFNKPEDKGEFLFFPQHHLKLPKMQRNYNCYFKNY